MGGPQARLVHVLVLVHVHVNVLVLCCGDQTWGLLVAKPLWLKLFDEPLGTWRRRLPHWRDDRPGAPERREAERLGRGHAPPRQAAQAPL